MRNHLFKKICSSKLWPKSQAEALATELPIKKVCIISSGRNLTANGGNGGGGFWYEYFMMIVGRGGWVVMVALAVWECTWNSSLPCKNKPPAQRWYGYKGIRSFLFVLAAVNKRPKDHLGRSREII